MEKKEKMDKKDTYMLVLTGLFYLYLWGKNIIGAVSHVSGWDWLAFIVLSVIEDIFLPDVYAGNAFASKKPRTTVRGVCYTAGSYSCCTTNFVGKEK